MSESARKSAPVHAQLAEVRWRLPSTPPDTSAVDGAWTDEAAPRHSFIALRQPRGVNLPTPRRALRPAPPPDRAPPSVTPSAPVTNELAYDVWEGPTALLVMVDLPGVDAEHVSLSLGSHALYLDLNVPSTAQRAGIASGRHSLCVELPNGLSTDALDASLGQGVLRVRITTGGLGPRLVSIRSTE